MCSVIKDCNRKVTSPSPIILHEEHIEGPEDFEGFEDCDELVSSPELDPWDEDNMIEHHGEILQHDQGTYLTKLGHLPCKVV